VPPGNGRLVVDNSWSSSISVAERFEKELRSVDAEGWMEHCALGDDSTTEQAYRAYIDDK